MKNRFRWMCLCLLLLAGALLLCACGYSEPPEVNPIDVFFSTVGWYGHLPSDQLGSTWRSEDGRVEFTIVSTLIPEHTVTSITGVECIVKEANWIHGEGYLELESGERIEIIYSDGRGGVIVIYEAGDQVDGSITERWTASEIKQSSFVAVVNKSTIYETSQRIRFNRVDD